MVNQNNIFKKIGYILNELQDQYEFLSANPEQLSELELELFLANANFLTDHVQIVKKINENNPVKELPTPDKQETQVHAVAEDEEVEPPTFEFIINDQQDKPADTLDIEEVVTDNEAEERVDYFEEQEIEEVIEEATEEVGPEPFLIKQEEVAPIIPTAHTSIEAEPALTPVDPVPSVVNTPGESVILTEPIEPVTPQHEQFAPQQPVAPVKLTLNDLLAGKNSSNTFHEENSRPAVTDLKKAVNLNEKLLYIKDLFNGYNLAYSEAIDIINKLPDFKAADAFLKNNYAAKNNWDAKQATVDKFYDLIRQRFPD
ncbi:MAG: hypothetical protein EOO92_04270 [Pedobacter sp.]|nr:MAG: hypothetical protein EOO92_04270 [Pedobacter sp.]